MQRYTIFFITVNTTCFGWFFHPSSGAQELYTQHLVCAMLACKLLPLAVAASNILMMHGHMNVKYPGTLAVAAVTATITPALFLLYLTHWHTSFLNMVHP